jgi:hypothetical protein
MMSVTQSANHEGRALGARRSWEAPVFNELSLRTETASKTTADAVPPPAQSPEPPLAKLGFSVESSFPLASRTEK